MPEIEKPTLLVVCDSHHCRFVDLGGHTMLFNGIIKSKENTYTDHEGRTMSPAAVGRGGMTSSNSTVDRAEDERLHEFSNAVSSHIDHLVQLQGIQEVYLAAPDKFLAELKKHVSKPTMKLISKTIDGNFMHEHIHETLIRFRPDLADAIRKLKEDENYSERKHLPSK